MNHRYSHILTPVRVGDLVLKNRLINSKSTPEGWQGQDPANYMTEQTISFAANIARNGASIVTCSPGMFRAFKGHTFFTSPFDMDDRHIQMNFRRLIERVHQYGAAANASTMCNVPNDVSISELHDMSIVPDEFPPGPESPFDMQGNLPPEITKEQIKEFIRQFTDCAVQLKDMGFDMINVYASYNASLLAKSLSPVFNQRTDEYGGSLENRARLLVELLTSVKEACGWGFPIELQLSGRENVANGYTAEDFVEYCKIFDKAGLVDIIQIRAWSGDMTHASSYNCQKDYPTNLRFAEMLKKESLKALVAPVGGFQDLDLIEGFIADGRTDLVAMGRAFICDPEYGEKLYEGRGEDVIACLRCDKCHGGVCSINPKVGIAPSMLEEDRKPVVPKRVAVIGGGPAGLYTAAECSKIGHSVVLYEKDETLGGQVKHADFMPNKWCMQDYKNSLIRACERYGVEIHTGTAATRDMIEKGNFDAVVAACGSAAKKGPVQGADLPKVWTPNDVFGREAELGENVVVVGGAMIAVDTALYLCQNGHKVTLVTRNREAAYDNTRHSQFQFKESLNEEPNLTIITRAQTLKITEDAVTVEVTKGGGMGGPGFGPPGMPPAPGGAMPPMEPETKEIKEIPCDNVVFSAGRKPLIDACLEFAGITPKFFIVGDANMLSGDQKQRHPGEKSEPSVDTTAHEIRHGVLTGYAAAHSI